MPELDDLKNEGLTPVSIELHGICGKFSIPKSNLRIRYFSTFASSKETNSHHHELLKMLKPMRELTDPSKIKDLRTLLQRDLSDKRVGTDLIPYLTNFDGEPNHVAFFPAILCVLMPHGFITDGIHIKYPSYKEYDKTLDYNNWKIEFYGDTPLAKLQLHHKKTDMIVLDGQHRANAFRVISKSFDTQSAENNIYSPFYRDVEANIPKEYDSDLPVTIMWFEEIKGKSENIKPEYISRKLFIDVNQNAKKVSKSRNILLDDKDPSALFTNTFYTYIANKSSFSSCSLSLLHSGFDYNKELGRSKDYSSLTLFLPEIIQDAFDWLFFSSDRFMSISRYKVSRERIRKNLSPYEMYFEETFFEVIKDLDDNERKMVREGFHEKAKSYFIEKLAPHLYDLFSNFELYEKHIESSCKLDERFKNRDGDWNSEIRREVWTKLFKGGEGLLYVYKDHKKSNDIEDYVSSINNITNEFIEIRSAKFDFETTEVNKLYDSLVTYAFIVGYLQAFHLFYKEKEYDNLDEAVGAFLAKVNDISTQDWMYIINAIKPRIEKNTDPKIWPTYRNLILRYIMEKGEFYASENFIQLSPDAILFRTILIDKLNTYTKDQLSKNLSECFKNEIDEEVFEERINSSYKESQKHIYKVKNAVRLNFDYKKIADWVINTKTKKDKQ